jgi:hypothetical protein
MQTEIEEPAMPHFRKLSETEVAALEPPTLGARAETAQSYDHLLAGFAVGDYARVELHDGEQRSVVRQRLQAAAKRHGLTLHFRSGPGPLLFHVEVALAAVASAAPAEEPIAAPRVEAQRGVGARPPRQRQTAGRYDDVLPRWMREGKTTSRDKRQGR